MIPLHSVTLPPIPYRRADIVVGVNDIHAAEGTPANDADWRPDDMPGFIAKTLDLGEDPDEAGRVVATLVRYAPSHPSATPAPSTPDQRVTTNETPAAGAADGVTGKPRRAVVWVHGLSDYFFQDHLAREIDAAGWDFYAIDLRKCGRSHRPGQRRHYASDFTLYDVDLNAALDEILAAGHPHVAIGAHSTGGIIIACWLDRLRTSDPERHAAIAGAFYDSPWFDLPLPDWQLPLARPLVRGVAKLMPGKPVPADGLGAYGESLHRSRHGAWEYSLEHKPLNGFEMPFRWLAAVVRAQNLLAAGLETGVPNLVLHSDRSWLGKPYSASTDTADAVLDVNHIARRAPKLGGSVRSVVIPGARHDVYLSHEYARRQALDETTRFLATLAQ